MGSKELLERERKLKILRLRKLGMWWTGLTREEFLEEYKKQLPRMLKEHRR